MDLIAELTSQLGMPEGQAKGLAGSLFGMLKEQVADKVGAPEAEELAANVPEIEDWAASGDSATDAGEAEGGLMGLAGSLLGGSSGGGLDIGSLIALAGKFNLDAGTAKSLLPIALQFLKGRLPAPLLEKIAGAIPLLGGGNSSGAGGLAGALGKLF